MTNTLAAPVSPVWISFLVTKTVAASRGLASRAEFAADLQAFVAHPDSPLASIEIKIIRPAPFPTVILGEPAPEGEIARFPVYDLFDEEGCWISIWYKPLAPRSGIVHFPFIMSQLSEWTTKFWKALSRSRIGLLSWTDPTIRDMLDAAIHRWLSQGQLVTALFADLDHLKDINDTFGFAKGDEVIQNFAVLLEENVPDSAIVLGVGGDEFLIFLPTFDVEDIFSVADRLSRAVRLSDFGTGSISVSAAIGVSTRVGFNEKLSAVTLATEAERAIKSHSGGKLRGSVSVFSHHSQVVPSSLNNLDGNTTSGPSIRTVPQEDTTSIAPARNRVFISYSHKDKEWLERLQRHLRPLERAGAVIWNDTLLEPGTPWREEIRTALAETKVAVLLISADFLASDFISTNELPPLLAAAEADGATILSVIISPSRFVRMESLSRFQAVNDPAKPLVQMRRANREKVLDDVARAVEDALKR
ncbi:MAG TPA: diguanylate cyclase [Longimicrobium sp.]|nr:diguanylate cyclase [Longimicrobium sp.]